MRIVLHATSIVVLAIGSSVGAQIRTPIATEPLPAATQPAAAPYNARAVINSPTSVTVSWDAAAGARGYMVERKRFDGLIAASASSGLITAPSWTDAALEAGQEYSFAITALYFDVRQGMTSVVASMPMPALPQVRTFKNADMSSAEGVLRLTPCGAKSSGGPGPATITGYPGSPAGARFGWTTVGSGYNYVVDRAVYGTTNWVLVGSTCGGPSPIAGSGELLTIQDLAGGVVVNGKYVYRVTAVGPRGEVGWNTYHFIAPCRAGPVLQAAVSGSTVTLTWAEDQGAPCSRDPSAAPDIYTLKTSFGFTKQAKAYHWTQEVIYGVPVGSHTVTMVGNYNKDGSTTTSTTTFNVSY